MERILAVTMTALDPLYSFTMAIWEVVPSLVAALVLLIVGALLGRTLRMVVERVLTMTSLDDYARRAGVSPVITRLGFGHSPTKLAGFTVYWMILLAFMLGAANCIQLTIVSEFLHRVVDFAPRLIAAVLVLGGGLFLGNFVGDIVYRAAQANGLRGSDALSKIAYGLLVIFSGIMALERLGIDISVLTTSMQIVIASIGLGCAIAFGVAFGTAGRDTAERWIRDLTPRHVPPHNGHSVLRERIGKER